MKIQSWNSRRSSTNERREKNKSMLFVLCLMGVNLLVFLPSVSGEFIYDDLSLIVKNPVIHQPAAVKHLFFSPYGGESVQDEVSQELMQSIPFYRPVSMLTFWMDYQVWGLNASGFHLTNLLINLANVILFYFILLELSRDRWKSFLSVLLFSVFPFHFENVSWISGRTDLVAFFFSAFSVWFFIKYNREQKFRFIGLSAFFFLLSLLSKENTVFLPLIYFLVLIKSKKPTDKLSHTAAALFPFIFSGLVWVVLRSAALQSLLVAPSGRHLADFFAIIGFYFLKVLFPFHLTVTVNSYPVFSSLFYQAVGIICCLLMAVSFVYVVKKTLSISHPSFICFSFFLLLLPSVLVVFSASALSYIAWRFLYLPSALFTAYLVDRVFAIKKMHPVPLVVILLLSVSYSVEVYNKNRLYGKSQQEFWLSIQNVHKQSLQAQFNVGVHMLRKDESRGLKILQDILEQKKHPFFNLCRSKVLEALGTYYTFKEETGKAAPYFNQLLRTEKAHPQSFYFNYAYFLALSGKKIEGERIVRKQLEAFPRNHLVLVHAARFYLLTRNIPKAKELLETDYQLFRSSETKALLKTLNQ